MLAKLGIYLIFFSAIVQVDKDDHLECLTRQSACQGYDIEFIDLVEMIYGKGFLSQGGTQSVKQMIGNLNLNGLNVLDIGSGLGGPCLYMAEQYTANITGLEPQKWMVEKAKTNLKQVQEKLCGSVNFVHMKTTSNLQQFNDNMFDVIVSKEALLHIPFEVKQDFFAEIYRVLKPGGKIIIMDWMHKTPNYSNNTKKMMELDGVAYNLISPEQYIAMLQKVGFIDITMENTTLEHATLSQQNLGTIQSLEQKITDKYGTGTYEESLDSWSYQRDAFKSEELLTGVLRAKKD